MAAEGMKETYTTIRRGSLSQFIAFLASWEYANRNSFPLWMVGPPWSKRDYEQSNAMTWWWIHVKQENRHPSDDSFPEVERWSGRALMTAVEFPNRIKIDFEIRSFPDPGLFWGIVEQWESKMDLLGFTKIAMNSSEIQHPALKKAKRARAILEEQAAGYTSLTIPAHLKIELEDKCKEVEEIEKKIQSEMWNYSAPGNERDKFDKWWERKESTYWEIIDDLAKLVDLLDRWMKELMRSYSDEGYNFSQESQEAVYTEYQKLRGQIRHFAIVGDYLFSINAARSLSTLSKQLEQEDQIETLESMIDSLATELKVVQECRKIMMDEAKVDLGV